MMERRDSGNSMETQAHAEELSDLVCLARQGKQSAIAALYEKSYKQVFYTIKSMIRDEDAVLDILQDTYIKAFTHLDTFDGNAKFLPWVRQIAANTARDYLKKRKPMLFAELTPEDAPDLPVEERFADSNCENMPDIVLDQEETKRLIREIIDGLPEDQRAVIGMYYYQEMSIKDISQSLGISQSAIKSRLLYGRQKIEAKVRELEKCGTKLYGLSPLPFLLWLLRGQETRSVQLPSRQILQHVLASVEQPAGAAAGTAAGSTTATAGSGASAAGTGAAAGGLGAVKLGIITLASVAVIGAGAWGISHLHEQPSADIAGTAEEQSTQEQAPQNTDAYDTAIARYGEIISRASSYTYTTSDARPTGRYRYSIFDLQKGDPVPTLLLAQETDRGTFYVRIFQYEPETDSMIQPEESLEEGSDGGGYHAGLARQADGNGIRLAETYGGSGDTEITRITLAGGVLVRESQWAGKLDAVPETLGFTAINWNEVSVRSSGAAGTSETTDDPNAGKASVSLPQSSGQEEGAEEGRIVFTGTIGTYSYDEVITLQGCPDPNAPWTDSSQTFRLIVLDTPQVMELEGIDGPRSDEVAVISVDNAEHLSQYEGKHMTFSIDPRTTFWPSDTSMPVGQPATRDIYVVK